MTHAETMRTRSSDATRAAISNGMRRAWNRRRMLDLVENAKLALNRSKSVTARANLSPEFFLDQLRDFINERL